METAAGIELSVPEAQNISLKTDVAPLRPFAWLGFLTEDGASAMERDHIFFEQFKKGLRPPALRFYSWQTPTLTYGRTQGLDHKTRQDALEKGYGIAQRSTGGGKVYHKDDLCFSLFWTRKHRMIPWKVNDSYCAIHKWIRHSLNELGLAAKLSGSPAGDPGADKSWCFQSPVEHDLLSNGEKIVGGAQWRDGNYALHQGSIQISRTPEKIAVFKRGFEEYFGTGFSGADPC